jgi:hypothetical protein
MNYAFLAGYTGKPIRSPAQLFQLAINLDAIVIDSRDVPFSRWAPHWNRPSLTASLGARYLWLKDFGNPTRHAGVLSVRNPAHGLMTLQKQAITRAIVLCACADGGQCHRKEVGAFLAGHGWTVREVTTMEWADARGMA